MAEHRVYAASCGLFLAGWRGCPVARRATRRRSAGRGDSEMAFAIVSVAFPRDAHRHPQQGLGESRRRCGARQSISRPTTTVPVFARRSLRGCRTPRLKPRTNIESRLRSDPMTSSFVKFGQFLAKRGSIDDARTQFEEALRLAPDDKDARQSMAVFEKIGSRSARRSARRSAQTQRNASHAKSGRSDRGPRPQRSAARYLNAAR